MITIEQKNYAPVQCDEPLLCPFCGDRPELKQLMHKTRSQRVGRKYETVRVCIVASTETMIGDTFWFQCPTCKCKTGNHEDTAQKAVGHWNRRLS